MAQYIDKSAVLAEIEKLKGKISDNSSYCNGWQHALRMLELSLDTLKVKEVDLEKKLSTYLEVVKATDEDIDFVDFAKHFFELGLKAQKGEKGMNKEYIWLFGRKVKITKDNTRTCTDCALRDICEHNLVGINECICSTGDNTIQKFIKAI